MESVYHAPPWNDDWTYDAAEESILTILEFPKFYGNVILDEDKIFGAIMGHITKYSKEMTYYIYIYIYLYRRIIETKV